MLHGSVLLLNDVVSGKMIRPLVCPEAA